MVTVLLAPTKARAAGHRTARAVVHHRPEPPGAVLRATRPACRAGGGTRVTAANTRESAGDAAAEHVAVGRVEEHDALAGRDAPLRACSTEPCRRRSDRRHGGAVRAALHHHLADVRLIGPHEVADAQLVDIEIGLVADDDGRRRLVDRA